MVALAFVDDHQALDCKEGLMEDPEVILSSDYFRMFVFKVEKCTRVDPHDWTLCQFAHPTEKAKRRDPTKYTYHYNSCTEFRKHGSCRSGDNCAFAHGVFEGWLSAQKYRTEMCTLGQHGCTRRVCFFAHSPAELRDHIPESLEETARLKEELLRDMFTNPVYALKLQQLLSVMTPTQASEVIGERLAYLQYFLNQYGPTALPTLLTCSQSDLQDLMNSMKAQAQKERETIQETSALNQQRMDAQLLNHMAETDGLNAPIMQKLQQQLYGNVPMNDADAAQMFSRIAVNNPPSSEGQFSGRSSTDSCFLPSQTGQFLTPSRQRRSSNATTGYASLGESSGTFDARSSLEGARSSMDSADTFRSVPRRSSLRTGNLFGGLLPVNDTFDTQGLQRPPARHSLDNAYQQALLAKTLSLGTSLRSPMPLSPLQTPMVPDMPVSFTSGIGIPITTHQSTIPAQLRRSGSHDSKYNIALQQLLSNQSRNFTAA